MAFAAIITARKDSIRIPGKNRAKVGGFELWHRSAMFAVQCGISPIIDSDDEGILILARTMGFTVHQRTTPSEDQGGTHWQAIQAVAKDYGLSRYALLQPTSPFRSQPIMTACLRELDKGNAKAILTTYAKGDKWDGNIGIFSDSDNKVPESFHAIRNGWVQSFQVDEPGDLEEARHLEKLLPNGGLW